MSHNYSYANYYAPSNDQQQRRPEAHYPRPAPTSTSVPLQYQQISGQANPKAGYPTLAERYTYNAPQPSSHYPVRSAFETNATAGLSRNPQYQSSSATSNPLQSQDHRSRGASSQGGAGHGQLRPGSANSSSRDRNISIPRSSYNLSSSNHTIPAVSHYQPQRTASPQWSNSHEAWADPRQSMAESNLRQDPISRQEWSAQGSNGVQQWSSTEPTTTTVDPSAVYDASHEYRRQAEIDRARRAEELARTAEESQRTEEASKKSEEEARVKERERIAREEKQAKVDEARQKVMSEASKASGKVNANVKAKSRKSDGAQGGATKRTSKNRTSSMESHQIQAAAETLVQAANSTNQSKEDLETQMRAMFLKMREFNQKDPELLSRLWQQEREAHLAKESKQPTDTSRPQEKHPAHQAKPSPKDSAQTPAASEASAQTPQPALVGQNQIAKQTLGNGTTAPASDTARATTAPAPTKTVPMSGAVWPASKKAELAEAASQIISKANSGRTIPPAEISKILDTKPNYLEFCQQLESRGFNFDRGQVAKALISAVPEFQKTRPEQHAPAQPATNGMPQASSQKVIRPASISTPADAEQRLMNAGTLVTATKSKPQLKKSQATTSNPTSESNMKTPLTGPISTTDNASRVIPIDPQLEGLDAVIDFVAGALASQPPPQMQPQPSLAKPPRERKPSKGQQRTPVPLVSQAPLTKHDLARKRTFQELIDLTAQRDESSDDDSMMPMAKRQETAQPVVIQLPTPAQTTVGTSPPAANSNESQSLPLSLSELSQQVTNQPFSSSPVPQGLGSGSQPANVQRDLPLPPHLPLDHAARQTRMIHPLDKYKAIRRSSYDPKTIARDVLIACGRHPEMRHLNAHLESLKAVFGEVDNNSDLSTFRWDIADPGGLPPGSGDPRITNKDIAFLEEIDADDEDSDNDSVLGSSGGRVAVRQAVSVGGGTEGSGPGLDVQPRKKRGRPPRKSEPGIRALTGDPGQRPPPRRSESAVGGSQAANNSARMTYQQLREQAEAEIRARGEEPPKRKGRPVGWRKWMQKNPGPTKPLTAKPSTKAPSPEPNYAVYKCDWKECGGKLHNLATLRRHIFKLHGKRDSNGEYSCLWTGCGKVKAVTDNATKRTMASFVPEDFATLEAWKSHIEKRHITPIAWKLGDGPKGGLSDNYESEVSESYMSDSHGRRVTPRVSVPQGAEQGAGLSGIDSQPKRQGKEDDEMEKVYKAEQNRKRDIGPAVDRQGAVLANSKRRQGFVDDEDIAEVVDEDD